jgi:hypothetical protein
MFSPADKWMGAGIARTQLFNHVQGVDVRDGNLTMQDVQINGAIQQNNLLRAVIPCARAHGISVREGKRIGLKGVDVQGMCGFGVLLYAASGTAQRGKELLVDNIRLTENRIGGLTLLVNDPDMDSPDQLKLTMRRAVFSENGVAGAIIKGASLEVEDSIFLLSRKGSLAPNSMIDFGDGLQLYQSKRTTLTSSVFAANERAGCVANTSGDVYDLDNTWEQNPRGKLLGSDTKLCTTADASSCRTATGASDVFTAAKSALADVSIYLPE